jgi:hypothetical protein
MGCSFHELVEVVDVAVDIAVRMKPNEMQRT